MTRNEVEAIEAQRDMRRAQDRATPQSLINDIVADSRRSREPSGVIPKVREPVPVPGAQAKGTNGWLPEKPFTHEPSFAERQMAKAFPAQGKRGL